MCPSHLSTLIKYLALGDDIICLQATYVSLLTAGTHGLTATVTLYLGGDILKSDGVADLLPQDHTHLL